MTIQEFEKINFNQELKVIYKNKILDIISWDDEEKLIQVLDYSDDDIDDEYFSWKRCENCELFKEKQNGNTTER